MISNKCITWQDLNCKQIQEVLISIGEAQTSPLICQVIRH